MMSRVSARYFRETIEDYFEDLDLDVTCRKRKQGYALYSAEDNRPLARLRPTGDDDDVEISWWDGDRWQTVGDFGLAMPLSEALEYVTDDPDGLFLPDVGPSAFSSTRPKRGRSEWLTEAALHVLTRRWFRIGMVGSAAGGGFAAAPWGLLAAVGAVLLWVAGSVLVRSRGRGLVLEILLVGAPAALIAGAGGMIGSAVCGSFGADLWCRGIGVLLAVLCVSTVILGGLLAWLVGFLAFLNLAVWLTNWLHIGDHFFGLAAMALLATVGGTLCRYVGDTIRAQWLPAEPAEPR